MTIQIALLVILSLSVISKKQNDAYKVRLQLTISFIMD